MLDLGMMKHTAADPTHLTFDVEAFLLFRIRLKKKTNHHPKRKSVDFHRRSRRAMKSAIFSIEQAADMTYMRVQLLVMTRKDQTTRSSKAF